LQNHDVPSPCVQELSRTFINRLCAKAKLICAIVNESCLMLNTERILVSLSLVADSSLNRFILEKSFRYFGADAQVKNNNVLHGSQMLQAKSSVLRGGGLTTLTVVALVTESKWTEMHLLFACPPLLQDIPDL
jgi:hypothetical protein